MTEGQIPRELAKRDTRQALIDAGIAEFAERGLVEPSLDAICARAGFTRGAFYVHFRDREDFISAVMECVLGQFLDAVIATGDEARDLEQTVTRYAETLAAAARGESHPLLGGLAPAAQLQFHRILEACARSPAIRERFASLLEQAIARVGRAAAEGQASGSVRAGVDPAEIATVLVAVAIGAICALEVGIGFDPAPARDAVLALLRP